MRKTITGPAPVVFGKNLLTYVAQVPPGGYMPPNGHAEKEEFETSLFLLEGELEITYDDETFTIGPETAMHRPPGRQVWCQEPRQGDSNLRLDVLATAED